MWLPGDLSVLATGHKFVIDLCCGVIRGRFGLSELVWHWSSATVGEIECSP